MSFKCNECSKEEYIVGEFREISMMAKAIDSKGYDAKNSFVIHICDECYIKLIEKYIPKNIEASGGSSLETTILRRFMKEYTTDILKTFFQTHNIKYSASNGIKTDLIEE